MLTMLLYTKTAIKSNKFRKFTHNIFVKKKKKWFLDIFWGGIIGFVNGFLGSGGGMLVVPVLEKLKNYHNKEAHATALAVILPLSVVSAVVYSFNFNLDWTTIGVLSASVTAGGVLGCFCLKKFSGKTIRIIFAVLMLGAGVYSILSTVL